MDKPLAKDILQMARNGYGVDRFGHAAKPNVFVLSWAEYEQYAELVYALCDNQLLLRLGDGEFILTDAGNRVLNVINNEMPIVKDFTQE